MSNSKKTIKSVFSNMFGNGKNLNIGKNKSTNELLHNISNSNLNSNEIIENNIQSSRSKNFNLNFKTDSKNVDSKNMLRNENKNLERKESLKLPVQSMLNAVSSVSTISSISSRSTYVIIIIIILILLAILFFYREIIVKYFKPDTSLDSATISANAANDAANATSTKVENTSAKVDLASAKVETTSAKIDDLNKKVDDLINTKSNCSNSGAINTLNKKLNNISPYKKSNITEDAYCYIGYDNGQRECVDVHAGDICMSGEIFPSLDICINPGLRP
jgi:hypothetical protein